MSGQTIERQETPGDMVASYRDEFALVLPSHIKPETWVRVAQGAVRRDPKLGEAARRSPTSLLAALMEAARKGLEPGTEEFYLIPRKRRGVPEVQGVEGYRGIIERMYRSGAVASVIVREVCAHDEFRFIEGVMDRPEHRIDWFTRGARGDMVGVYAYAVLTTGAVSRVVVLNGDDIDDIKRHSDGSDESYSPWQTEPRSMWWKSAARRLEPWVPTSAEYRREQLRAAQEVAAERAAPTVTAVPETPAADGEVVDGEIVDPVTGEIPWSAASRADQEEAGA